jgi:anti-sigma factor RsiW
MTAERPDNSPRSSERSPLEPERMERLNAYLDGELSAEERNDLERELADNPQLQTALQGLQRAWDLLDSLPRSMVGDEFAQSTVEMIAVSAADELTAVQAPPPRRVWFDRLLAGAATAVAAVAGFILVDAVQTPADEALVRDLPVIENIDLYGRAEQGTTVEFLRTLHDRKLLENLPPDDARRP